MPLLFAIALVAAATSPREEVIARAGPVSITGAQFLERVDAMRRPGGGEASVDAIVEDLVNDGLFAEEAAKRGLKAAPEVVAAADAERRRRASARFVEKEIHGAVKIDEPMLREMFHETGDWALLHMIVLASKEEAQALFTRLEKGGDFAAEARHSLDPRGASRKGDLGTSSRGQIQKAVRDAAFSAPLGKLQGPVQLELGWGVWKVTERTIADDAGFQHKRTALRAFAEAQMRSQAKQHYVQQLRRAANVTPDEAFLRTTATRVDLPAAEAQKVVATINGRPLRYAQIASALHSAFGGKEGGHFSGLSVKLELFWSIADEMLLEDAALKAGFDKDPTVAAGVASVERTALAAALAAKLRASAPAPTPAEVEAAYKAAAAQFKRPAQRTCSQLLASTEPRAVQMRKRLLGGEDFEDVARDYSEDRATATKGGLLGVITDDALDALAKTEGPLAAAIRGAKAKTPTDPVKSRAGWHVLRCDALAPARTIPLAEVEAQIRAGLVKQRGDEAVRRELAGLRTGIAVKVDAEALKRVTSAAQRPAGGAL